MRKHDNTINRRRFFCCSIAGLTVNAMRAKLSFGIDQNSTVHFEDEEFLIVNGWVLSRTDVTASKMTSDVV